VLRDLGRFTWKGAGFEAWLFRIASNLVFDHLRAGRREQPAEDIEFAETAELRTPEWAVMEGETTRELNNLLVTLPDDQQEVLLLRFAGGLSAIEVGAVTGRKPNAVRQMQFRALEALRVKVANGVQKR
jgi:RNA polymerase sigma-70 factor (ECF subfamily)